MWFASLCQAAGCLSKRFLQAESHHYLQPLGTVINAAFKASGSYFKARTCAPPSQLSLPSLLRPPQAPSGSFRSSLISWLVLGSPAPAVLQATARTEQWLSVARGLTGRMEKGRLEHLQPFP